MAFLLEDMGILAARAGDATAAFEALGAASRMRDEIDAPRSPALERSSPPPSPMRARPRRGWRDARVERGRAMEPDQVEDLGRRICEGA